MLASPDLLRLFCCVALFVTLTSCEEYDEFQMPEENPQPRFIAGIPYGSKSGHLAEYFATLKTPLPNPKLNDDFDLRTKQSFDESGSNFHELNAR